MMSNKSILKLSSIDFSFLHYSFDEEKLSFESQTRIFVFFTKNLKNYTIFPFNIKEKSFKDIIQLFIIRIIQHKLLLL